MDAPNTTHLSEQPIQSHISLPFYSLSDLKFSKDGSKMPNSLYRNPLWSETEQQMSQNKRIHRDTTITILGKLT